MGPFAIAALVAGTAFVASLTFDMGLNVAQDWFNTVYTDAFWSTKVSDTPAIRELTKEEAEIDRLLQSEDFAPAPPRK